MGASVGDLGSVVAVREVVARRGNCLSGAGGGGRSQGAGLDPGTVHCALCTSLSSPGTLLSHSSPVSEQGGSLKLFPSAISESIWGQGAPKEFDQSYRPLS